MGRYEIIVESLARLSVIAGDIRDAHVKGDLPRELNAWATYQRELTNTKARLQFGDG